MENEFSLEAATVPVTLIGTKGNESFLLKEMSAENRDKHLDDMRVRVERNDKGEPVNIKNFSGMQGGLLSLCMVRVGEDGKQTPVTLKEIQGWPSTVVGKLHKAATVLNKLGAKDIEEGAEEAKKE